MLPQRQVYAHCDSDNSNPNVTLGNSDNSNNSNPNVTLGNIAVDTLPLRQR